MVFSTEICRQWLIPGLQALSWLGSFLVSIFYPFASDHIVATRQILAFCTIALVFELLLAAWDAKLATAYCVISRNLRFDVECRILPFLIFAVSSSIGAFSLNWAYVVFYGLCLGGMKFGLSNSYFHIDRHKEVDDGYSFPSDASEFYETDPTNTTALD